MSNSLVGYHAKWVKDGRSYHDVFWIMQHYLNIGWADLQVKSIDDFDSGVLKDLEKALLDYQMGKPLGYIIGHVEFCQLPIMVAKGVLIPRVDTEPMVEEIISRLIGTEKILELGVGSGAISCAIAYHKPGVTITAIDQSVIACEIARRNVEKLGLSNIDIVHADWQDFSQGGFDWVIANPPYIAKDDPALAPEVKQYEPLEAVISAKQGFSDLDYITNNAAKWLVKGGHIALEHGYKQQNRLKTMLEQEGFNEIILGSDGRHPRYILARY